jgi:hypothetical protein
MTGSAVAVGFSAGGSLAKGVVAVVSVIDV